MSGALRPRVLAVDDEKAILRALTLALEARGYYVIAASSAQAALDECAARMPAAVLLDLGLPDLGGIETVERLCARGGPSLPVIVLTALGADDQKLAALDAGAYDCLTKPYSMPELLARLQAALDHLTVEGERDELRHTVGDLAVVGDGRTAAVWFHGAEVDLTPDERAVVALLASQPGRVRTHRAILRAIHGGPDHDHGTLQLRAIVQSVRAKLADDPRQPHLRTEPGVGYRLVDPNQVRAVASG